jgi:UDP-glucose 4-epimerase
VLEVLEVFGLAYVITQWRSGDAVITVAEHTEADQLLIWQIRCR